MPVAPAARVVLLAGPSGSGKSRVAALSNLPIVRLDDFYRADTAPNLPHLPTGEIDWDHPDSWDAASALAAIEQLCRTGSATVPRYDLAANGPNGTRQIDLDGAPVFVAEGIFVRELVSECAARGVLAAAIYLQRSRWVTMGLRLRRDLAERRKSPLFLLRRGFLLARMEPKLVQSLRSAGCQGLSPTATVRRLRELSNEPSTSPHRPPDDSGK